MQKQITWIIAAKSTCAKIFTLEKVGVVRQIEVLEHPESKLHERDLGVDRPGRSSERTGPSRYAFEGHMPLHEQEAHNFAAFLAHHLEKERESGSFHRLYISAAPHFLGIFRQKITPQTAQLVVGDINVDMTHLSTDEVWDHISSLQG